MRALMVEADWEPRGGYSPEPGDEERRLARNGNLVWKHPRFRVADLPEPSPGADEVLIRVRACGVCGSDVHMYEKDDEGYMVYPGMLSTPVVTGHEFSGVVEAVGENVVDLEPGDAVCSEEIAWCGECYACRAGRFNYCERLGELGFTFNGAHAEYVVTKSKYCWPIDEMLQTLGDERGFRAAALVEPTSVAYVGMFVQASFLPGASVAVIGGGPIGLAAVGLARAAGAGRVVAFETVATRRRLAEEMGADAVYDSLALDEGGIAEAATEETRGRGIDMWVEASGAEGVIDAATGALAPTATVVLVGRGPHRASIDPERLVVAGGGLRGSLGHSGAGTFGNVIRLMASGRLDMSRIVTDPVGLDGAVEGLERLRDREAGKYMVLFE
ncbi:MAG TPA: scyllo-inosose 3-dehydrogenase [Rubrobacter sp.]|jgi:scyllo-inosose 3-dehydrogenase|nr:scyllo-inosose 3-dehydrogenase [Rubrobacter sp.]